MKHINKPQLAIGLLFGFATLNAQAALQSRAGGTMVYDTDLNITWVADANLFRTQEAGNPNLISEIIAANGGVINDTPNAFDGNDGVYNLSAADFGSFTRRMSWFGAQAWVNSLNYGGFSDWRLPSIAAQATGYNITDSELGHLFYNELGGVAGQSIVTTHNADYNLFSNIEPTLLYWTAAEYATNPYFAFSFYVANGHQGLPSKNSPSFALAVRDGDVAAVPVPGAVWLFTTSLVGWLGLKRRSNVG